MADRRNGLMVFYDELPLVQRALRSLIASHGGTCHCQACDAARPLMERVVDKLTTPVPRSSIRGEARC